MNQTLITTLGFLCLLMAPSAHAQRYLVNGHPTTAREEQVLASYGFDAGAWRMDGSFPNHAGRSATTCLVCRSTATRYGSPCAEGVPTVNPLAAALCARTSLRGAEWSNAPFPTSYRPSYAPSVAAATGTSVATLANVTRHPSADVLLNYVRTTGLIADYRWRSCDDPQLAAMTDGPGILC
jgi:hypothetical protein